MELDDEAKEIVQGLGAAINAAIGQSAEVAAAIEGLREAGYELELTLKLEIGLRPLTDEGDEAVRLELTDDDRRTLRSMKIRLDDAD